LRFIPDEILPMPKKRNCSSLSKPKSAKGKEEIISNRIEEMQNSWEFISKNTILFWTQFFMHEIRSDIVENKFRPLGDLFFKIYLTHLSKFTLHCRFLSMKPPLHFYPYSWSKCKRELHESGRVWYTSLNL